ncbi:hypothetical protein [Paenibacillus sp. GP183]|uniref:hypothetical protein n=1 Tax=Paenibacillus sp. GP183 TaxID=1882751 RepID=UPI000B871FA1
MIERIFFQIQTAGIPLGEMAMITFTPRSGPNMFHKLRNVFYERYKVIGADDRCLCNGTKGTNVRRNCRAGMVGNIWPQC